MGLRASYIATVEGSAARAFGAAREAYNAHEKVLELDKGRKDAGLIVGTYRYIVSALSLPMRLVAYMAGFGGDKARGIRMVEEAAAYGGENQEDARFALVLMYNREKRYDQALEQLALIARTISAEPAGLAGECVDRPARRTSRRCRTLSERGAGTVRR